MVRAWASGTDRERTVLFGLWALAVLSCLLGLALPPAADHHRGLQQQVLDLARVVSTASLAAVLVLGPGLVWRARRHRRGLGLAFLPLPGLALLVAVASLAWVAGDEVSPRLIAFLVLLPVLGGLLVGALRTRPGAMLEREERFALLVAGCVLGIAAARALWSIGPEGELYAETVSRTLEVGDRSDSRIPFHIVQLVAYGTAPFSDLGNGYFWPYNFSDRGPLAGLASAPLVFLAGGRPSAGMPDQPWVPFDAQGFMAYRLAMMTFACTAFLSLWTLTRRLAGDRAARLALLLAATTPFLVHDVWFTWPKLLAASFVLLAVESLLDGRALRAGLLVGIGYLAHPLALLSLPVVALLALWPLVGARVRRPHVRAAALVLGGTLACLVAWRLVNGSHYTQANFLDYLTRAGPNTPPTGEITVSSWLEHRLESVANTLVPLRLFLFSERDPAINAVDLSCEPSCFEGSPGAVHFFFQHWNALPFGVGIVFFALLSLSLWRAARRWPWAVFVTVVLPFLGFTVYWGGASTGMLREGLHTWILTLLAVVAVEQADRRFAWLCSRPIRALLALRAVEVLLIAVVPTLATRHRLIDGSFALTDVLALSAMVALSAALAASLWREPFSRVHGRPRAGHTVAVAEQD